MMDTQALSQRIQAIIQNDNDNDVDDEDEDDDILQIAVTVGGTKKKKKQEKTKKIESEDEKNEGYIQDVADRLDRGHTISPHDASWLHSVIDHRVIGDVGDIDNTRNQRKRQREKDTIHDNKDNKRRKMDEYTHRIPSRTNIYTQSNDAFNLSPPNITTPITVAMARGITMIRQSPDSPSLSQQSQPTTDHDDESKLEAPKADKTKNGLKQSTLHRYYKRENPKNPKRNGEK